MKTLIHRSGERGSAEHGWLHSRFSFSFAGYFNPKRMGFGALRVLNDDVFEPGGGFGMHRHDNMEIVTIVLDGSLEHNDSMGNHGVIPAGDVQRMSAGAGITHSEINSSKTQKVHLLQVWVLPMEQGIEPGYEQRSFKKMPKNRLVSLACGEKKAGSMYLHQDAEFLLGEFGAGKEFFFKTQKSGHGLFVFIIEGAIGFEKLVLNKGDSAEISGAKEVKFVAMENSKVLLIRVPLK